MSDRDVILSKLRRSIRSAFPGRASRDDVMSRRAPPQNRLHASTAQPSKDADLSLEERFIALLAGQGTTVRIAQTREAIPGVVRDYLASVSSPQLALRLGGDPLLVELDWASCPALTIEHGPATFADQAAMSRAFAGVAEAGACVLASGPENPISLSFMPETHIILLHRQDIVSSYDEAWDKARTLNPEHLPRSVTLVSGPSRTADIGGRPVLGAHGPRNLMVILVG